MFTALAESLINVQFEQLLDAVRFFFLDQIYHRLTQLVKRGVNQKRTAYTALLTHWYSNQKYLVQCSSSLKQNDVTMAPRVGCCQLNKKKKECLLKTMQLNAVATGPERQVRWRRQKFCRYRHKKNSKKLNIK